MSLFRAQNQALAMRWGPMSIDLNGKPIIRKITVTTSCHHFVPRTTIEVSRIFVQIFMAGYSPLQGILRVDEPSAELFRLLVDPISPLTIQNPTIQAGVDWNQVSQFVQFECRHEARLWHCTISSPIVPWTPKELDPSNFSSKQQGVNCCCDR